MRTRPGKSAGRLPRVRRCTLRREPLPGRAINRVRQRVGQPVDERKTRVHLDREATVGRRDEHASPYTKRLAHEAALALAAADVLDHRIREHDVELAVTERKGARVPLDVPNARVARTEPLAVLQPERGDPLWPGVARLEEVERATPVALAERKLVGPDVEHGGLSGRPQLVEEQPQLPLPRAQGDGISESHRA